MATFRRVSPQELDPASAAQLHVERAGAPAGEPVVCLHGLTGHGRRWLPWARRYLADFQVLAPDLLGHGYSPAPPPWDLAHQVAAVARVVTALPAPAIVVAHSFGGAVALEFAARFPDLCRALVLFDPAAGLPGARLQPIAETFLDRPGFPNRAAAFADKRASGWGRVPAADIDRELADHLIEVAPDRYYWRLYRPTVIAAWGELARPPVLPPARLDVTLIQAAAEPQPFLAPEVVTGLSDHLREAFHFEAWDSLHMVQHEHPVWAAARVRAAAARTVRDPG